MSVVPKRGRIRRILVALDASPGSRAAARAAARAAVLLRAELVGLFVEDQDLLLLSRSPLARRGDVLSATVGLLEEVDLEHEMRVQAARAERSLTVAAGRAGVTCTFQVTRGPVAKEILAEAGDSDLVSLGRIGWTLRRRRTLGRTAKALLARPGMRALFVERSEDLHAPMVVLFDGSPAGCEALDQALGLAYPGDASLTILLSGMEPRRLRLQAEERLGEDAPLAHFHNLTGTTGMEAVARIVERLGAGLLLAPMGATGLDVARLQTLLEWLDCPILVVS